MMMHQKNSGFTLLIALILTSVTLAVGIALLDVAVKQILLSSAAKQSQYAFYRADSALECTLFFDQKRGVFQYDFPGSQGNPDLNVRCGGLDVTNYAVMQDASVRKTTFTVPCAGGGIAGSVTVLKQPSGNTNIYANGYNTCDENSPVRIERGLKIKY